MKEDGIIPRYKKVIQLMRCPLQNSVSMKLQRRGKHEGYINWYVRHDERISLRLALVIHHIPQFTALILDCYAIINKYFRFQALPS